MILTTPALAALRKTYPSAEIDFLVEPPGAQVLEGNPHLSHTLVYNAHTIIDALSWIGRIRHAHYDWVIDFMGNPRSALITALSGACVRAGSAHVAHRWAYNLRMHQPVTPSYVGLEKILLLNALGIESSTTSFLPHLYLTDNLPRQKDNRIGFAPASRKSTRRWPAASYATLGQELRARHGSTIEIFWGPGEQALAQEIAARIGDGAIASPETHTLKDLAQRLSSCRLLVTNCNGPKHMAVALSVPTVTIHGSSDPASWTPPDPQHIFVRKDELFCIGCRRNECPYNLECLNQLPVAAVLTAVERILDPIGVRA